MDGLPIQPIAASLAGADIAARRQLEALAIKRSRLPREQRQVEPPTRVDPVDDAPDRERRRERPAKKDAKPGAGEDHVDLTA